MLHEIYPSSKVPLEAIEEYGWSFVEDIPTITNEHGRLSPSPERSEIHTQLRADLDTTGSVDYETLTGEVFTLRDFAIAESIDSPKILGFFALK